MKLTIQFLDRMLRKWGYRIDEPLETYLLAAFEEDPFPYKWSKVDLHDQVRKLIIKYEEGSLDVSIPPLEERQRARYESLKESYVELLQENTQLRAIINQSINLLETRSIFRKVTLESVMLD
jgi:hypothetical protein